MRKEQYLTVHELQIRVRPIPHWSHDPSQNGGIQCQPVGGGNGVHLRGSNAEEVAQKLASDSSFYLDIHQTLVKSNRPIPQSYLDMCRGQEL
jgi:hypothetical protein